MSTELIFSTEAARQEHAKTKTLLSNKQLLAFVVKDKAILKREAKAINATVDWQTYGNRFEIQIHAPEGFVWAATNQPTLECHYERLSPDSAREAVRDLISEMGRGYDNTGDAEVSDEDHEYYEEGPRELDFTY